MRRYRLTTGHVTVGVSLPEQLSISPEVSSEADVTLPGGWVLDTHGQGGTGRLGLVVSMTGDHPSVTVESGGAVHVSLRPEAASSLTLAYVTYTALERQRQHDGMVTAHGSGVVVPGRGAVMLVGDKGGGKTATLLALMDRGCVPAGDDLIVLRRQPAFLELLSGRRLATVRGAGGTEQPFYDQKNRVDLGRGLVRQATRVDRVVRLNVHSGATGPVIRQLVDLSTTERLRIHENLGRYISGLPTPLGFDGCTPEGGIWPLDDARCAALRRQVAELFCKAPFYLLQARSAEEAAELVLTGLPR